MMFPMIEDILGIVFIAVIILRIFLLRPHWLGNIISFVSLMIIMIYGEVEASESWGGIAIGCAVWVLLLCLLAKLYDKRRARKKAIKEAVKQAAPSSHQTQPQLQVETPPQQSSPKSNTQPKQQSQSQTKQRPVQQPARKTEPPKPAPVLVEQTLNYCVRCRAPLNGPKCTNCNFDYTSDSILLLCKIEPEKLQIRVDR